ncbi:MAG: tyrosine--tRNA ligase [Candidatus Paceibacterota bacterium]|jgi:tyrosyl-tRNA synthetase
MNLDDIIRGSTEVIGQAELEKKIKSGKKLRVKHGADPTTTKIHLGYVVNYRVMRRFQDAGHTVIFLLGDFTGRIGDPTDKLEARQGQSKEVLRKNAEAMVGLVTKILNKDRLEIRYNSEWWDKTNLDDFLKIAKKVSATRLWERDMFEKRTKQGKPVWTHEFLYPILQAQDSVELDSDLTVIGSDQKFNELLARELQKEAGQVPQALVLMPILPGIDGEEKMSQSLGNIIAIDEAPEEIYGKIMSMPDKNILTYFGLLTDIKYDDLLTMKTEMVSQVRNPRDVKMQLAREIVKMLYSESEASKAEEYFKSVFQKKEIPDEIGTYKLEKDDFIIDLLVKTKLAPSRTEARRLVEQGGIKVNDQIIDDPMMRIKKADCPAIIRKGKRFFVKVV